MSVENPNVIDFVVRSPKTKELLLVMVEVRDLSGTPQAIDQLHAKFRVYAEYIMSGALAGQYPDLAEVPVTIRLDHFVRLNDEVVQVLRGWAGRLSGLKIGVCSHRLYWNPVKSLFHGLAGRFGKPDYGIVRWTAEPGSTPVLVSRSRFTEEFAATLRQSVPQLEIMVTGDLELQIQGPSGGDNQCYLFNAYSRYLLDPEKKEEIFSKFCASFREQSSNSAEIVDRARLVPILKDKAWIAEMDQSIKERKAKGITSVYEPYNDELVVVYAQDTPTNVRYLTSEDVGKLRIEMSELRSLAWANLAKIAAEPDVRLEHGIYRITAGGDYDACILLLDDFWNHAKLPVNGELVATVPARDFLAVTGSEDRESIAKLRSAARSVAAQAPYRLTPQLFIRRAGKFVVYEG